jgi:Zn ribbon nucleic-acid-binding protein
MTAITTECHQCGAWNYSGIPLTVCSECGHEQRLLTPKGGE